MFIYGGFRFLYYLSEEHLVYFSHLFNKNQNIIVYPATCCSKYTKSVTKYTLVFPVYLGSSSKTKKTFFY